MSNQIDNKICDCNSLKERRGFNGWEDYYNFKSQIEKSLHFEQISVDVPVYKTEGFEEKWFRCVTCGQKWSLATPDPPFSGDWIEVE